MSVSVNIVENVFFCRYNAFIDLGMNMHSRTYVSLPDSSI